MRTRKPRPNFFIGRRRTKNMAEPLTSARLVLDTYYQTDYRNFIALGCFETTAGQMSMSIGGSMTTEKSLMRLLKEG